MNLSARLERIEQAIEASKPPLPVLMARGLNNGAELYDVCHFMQPQERIGRLTRAEVEALPNVVIMLSWEHVSDLGGSIYEHQ